MIHTQLDHEYNCTRCSVYSLCEFACQQLQVRQEECQSPVSSKFAAVCQEASPFITVNLGLQASADADTQSSTDLRTLVV